MRILFALLFALAAGAVMAHSTAPTTTAAVQVKATPTTLMEALQPDRAAHGCAGQPWLALIEAGSESLIGGPVYCRKMLACCDNGNASCCALFERYCDPG